MDKSVKTIKEIADELGVSKDKVKYQVRKLPDTYLGKLPSGKIVINEHGVKIISERMGKSTHFLTDLPNGFTHLLPNENDQFIAHLEKLVDQQQKQIENLQKLLENQQVLTLKAQERVQALEQKEQQKTEYEVPNTKSTVKNKWRFWQ